ncbi:membrane protein [Clostridia bacterium]|nr:membrane protein [Clostridia bacterium]
MILTSEKFKTTIGGSALVEGIMMRGPDKVAYVVRGADGLVVKEKDLPKNTGRFRKIPFVRGVFGFASSMKESFAALNFSAEVIPIDEEPESKFDKWLEKISGGDDKKLMKGVTAVAMFIAAIVAVGLFVVLPIGLMGLITNAAGDLGHFRAVFEGVLRIVILFAYIFVISRMSDMKRVFGYHGAEHKTIHCYESGEELTVENVRRHTRFHPRCGTSFLLMVCIIGILVFLWVSSPNILVRVGLKLLMLPIVVGISYEINRLLGRYDNRLCRFIRAPGLWLQRLTTNEPDDGMIEVGIDALTRVIPADEGSDEWK